MAEAITLYLEIKKGHRADLEVVGFAAAAFAEAVKEIAFILEPGVEVRLEFESAHEGSIKLNALLRSLRTPDGRRGALVGIVATVGLGLMSDVRTYLVGRVLDHYLMPEQRVALRGEDIERIAKAAKGIKEGTIAKGPVQRMYRHLERDSAIDSVGSIARPDTKPINPVPRSEFLGRAGIVPTFDETPKSRRTVTRDLLTLISPVFLNTDRVWRFSSALGEHSYHISDLKFLNDSLNGKFKMKEGVQITAQVETIEEHEGGVWIPKRRTILKVIRRHRLFKNKGQSDLFDARKKRKK